MNMNIPAGLEDHTLEIYRFKNKARAILNGTTVDYLTLPDEMREPFQADLIADRKACNCLRMKLGITGADEMEETFVSCRYGACNHIPDLMDGKTTADMPVCDETETCPGFDIICKAPVGPGGSLARREFQIAVLISGGKLDKEIADELGIKLPTVRTHINRIHEKLGINNRIEIALWMHKQGIL
jgi:DNA-binding CsgD family transcriptional regulator